LGGFYICTSPARCLNSTAPRHPLARFSRWPGGSRGWRRAQPRSFFTEVSQEWVAVQLADLRRSEREREGCAKAAYRLAYSMI
jgi:hypothetical protein